LGGVQDRGEGGAPIAKQREPEQWGAASQKGKNV